MNYLPFVSWGMYGGTTATERANYFASWGLMAALPALAGAIAGLILSSRVRKSLVFGRILG